MAKSGAERQKDLRQRKKRQGYKQINMYLDRESTERLEKLMTASGQGIVDTFKRALGAYEYAYSVKLGDAFKQQKKTQKPRKKRRKEKEQIRQVRI